MLEKRLLFVVVAILLLAAGPGLTSNEGAKAGYFDHPPVYAIDDIYAPLRLMGVGMPPANKTIYDLGTASVEDAGFRSDGTNVQPALDVKLLVIRASVSRRIAAKTSLALSVPYAITRVGGGIGGRPTSASIDGLGNIALLIKHNLSTNKKNDTDFVAVAGIDLPIGKDNASFDQSNPSTNGYYSSGARLPLAWQTSTGSTNGYLGLAYGKTAFRHSYEGILAYKFYGKGDDSVRLGNILYVSASGTYAWNAKSAISMALTWRQQQNDSYSNSTFPVASSMLAGTTVHGNTLSFTPSIRFRVSDKITVGAILDMPLSKPKDGMVPATLWNVIFSL